MYAESRAFTLENGNFKPDSKHWKLDSGYKILDTRNWTLDTEHKELDAINWKLENRLKKTGILRPEHNYLDTKTLTLETGNLKRFTRHWIPEIKSWIRDQKS